MSYLTRSSVRKKKDGGKGVPDSTTSGRSAEDVGDSSVGLVPVEEMVRIFVTLASTDSSTSSPFRPNKLTPSSTGSPAKDEGPSVLTPDIKS